MWKLILLAAGMFYALTPGVLVSLPPGGTTQTVRLTHAVVFGVAWVFLAGRILKMVS